MTGDRAVTSPVDANPHQRSSLPKDPDNGACSGPSTTRFFTLKDPLSDSIRGLMESDNPRSDRESSASSCVRLFLMKVFDKDNYGIGKRAGLSSQLRPNEHPALAIEVSSMVSEIYG